MTALNRLRDGEVIARLRTEYLQIHKWNKMYSLVVVRIDGNRHSQILVSRPEHYSGLGKIDAVSCFKITYLENVFAEIQSFHGTDHVKGRTLYSRLCERIHNIPRPVCKMFTDTCPLCVERLKRSQPHRWITSHHHTGIRDKGSG